MYTQNGIPHYRCLHQHVSVVVVSPLAGDHSGRQCRKQSDHSVHKRAVCSRRICEASGKVRPATFAHCAGTHAHWHDNDRFMTCKQMHIHTN